MKPIRPVGLVLLFLFIAIPVIPAHAQEAPQADNAVVDRFDPKRDAARDIENAVAAAGQTGRRVLLDVGGTWCVWCRRLDSLFVRRADLAEVLRQNYVLVKVNYSPENKNEKVLSQYPRIAGYPHYFVLNSDGSLLHSQETGALEVGKGHDPEKVMAFLKRWAPEHSPAH